MSVALITIDPLAILQQYASVPFKLSIPGVGDVHAPPVGWTSGNYMLVDVAFAGTPQDQFSTEVSKTLSLAGSTLTITTTYQSNAPTQAQLKAYASAKRQAKMIGGTTVGSVFVPTDAGTLALISLAYSKALATPAFTMTWTLTGASPIVLTNAQVISSAQAVGLFLANCMASEATAITGINAATITTLAQIDALF